VLSGATVIGLAVAHRLADVEQALIIYTSGIVAA
jgi:hypothetical protein